MRKLFTLAVLAGALSIVACGPSKEELEKQKQMREDSIRVADSLATIEEAARQQRVQDSLNALQPDSTTAPTPEAGK